ncbi:Tyrosine recombinase xerC [Spirochaeta thermophila DSM 6578]|uniref:Tyrosine recombinase XerC n=1 Tax=Winmispira thermophila (strain ATCC 700085 / DSM 6578 / Z-1203) TaxID=869211 RepID=G0GCB4_WINT7|nr:tyrosine recombinase [Spirochaeta thermophila]AEJ61199.1 Tyrosine recombinase xerC [Spirochaeta thermophila DSM 6578]
MTTGHERLLRRYRTHLVAELGRSRLTEETYLPLCERFCAWLECRGLEVETVSRRTCEEFIVDERGEGKETRTIAKEMSALRSFFRFLVLEGVRPDNPLEEMDAPRISRTLPRVLEEEEVEILLEAVDTTPPEGMRDRCLLEVLYSCGLRVSEACGLDLQDIFLSEGFVKVRGKGEKERLVPFGKEAGHWMRRYLSEARPVLAARRPGSREQAVFLNRWGRRLSRKGAWIRLKRLVAASGVDAKLHTFRHTCATHLLHGGANLREVQEFLGHADISTTQIYTHVDARRLASYHHMYHPRG